MAAATKKWDVDPSSCRKRIVRRWGAALTFRFTQVVGAASLGPGRCHKLPDTYSSEARGKSKEDAMSKLFSAALIVTAMFASPAMAAWYDRTGAVVHPSRVVHCIRAP